MTLADDLVRALQPFVDAGPDLEDYLRAIGGMWAQVDAYSRDPDESDVPVIFTGRQNQAGNPGFEYDTVGSAPAWWTMSAWAASSLSIDVSTAWSSHGVKSAHLVGNGMGANSPMFIFRNGYLPVTPGKYTGGRAKFKTGATGPIHPELWLQFYDASYNGIGGTLKAVGTSGTNTAQTLQVGGVAPPGTAYSSIFPIFWWEGGATSPSGVDGWIDDVEWFTDGPAPSHYWDGDFAGYYWTGTPGNSPSAPVAPLPEVGWRKMMDVDRADYGGLPWLAQWIGERLPAGLPDAQARAWIKRGPNANRGQEQAIAHGIMQYLTGTQAVFTRPRYKVDGTADPKWLAVLTFATETPNSARVQDVLRRTLVPANILLDYQTVAVRTWAGIESGSPTWATVESGQTWAAVESAGSGYVPAGFKKWLP